MMDDIRTTIEDGQAYVDEPVYSMPVKLMGRLATAMAEIHGHVQIVADGDGFLHKIRTDLPPKLLMGYQRTWLNWV